MDQVYADWLDMPVVVTTTAGPIKGKLLVSYDDCIGIEYDVNKAPAYVSKAYVVSINGKDW